MLWHAYNERFGIFINTHYRLKCVPILEVPEAYEGDSVIKRLWGIHEFFLAAYCQRIVNSSSPLVKPNLTPEKLRSAQALLETAPTYSEYNRELILRKRRELKPDATQCARRCRGLSDGMRAIRLPMDPRLVHTRACFARRTGAALPRSAVRGVRRRTSARGPARHYVVSHGWAAHLHFDPSGGKLRDLAAVLTRLGAAPTMSSSSISCRSPRRVDGCLKPTSASTRWRAGMWSRKMGKW